MCKRIHRRSLNILKDKSSPQCSKTMSTRRSGGANSCVATTYNAFNGASTMRLVNFEIINNNLALTSTSFYAAPDDKHLTPIDNGCRQPRTPRHSPSQRSKKSPPKTKLPGIAVANAAYAGAKFSEPPSPKVLPRPPVHWTANGSVAPWGSCAEMTSILKGMLKVQS